LSLHGSASVHATSAFGLTWSANSSPFALTFQNGTRALTSEATAAGGAGQRLGFMLRDGATHYATELLTTRRTGATTTYTVATDDPARRMSVSVRNGENSIRVGVAVAPSTGVAATFESFAASPSEHFLGGGENGDYVDLRGHDVPLQVSYKCGSEFPMPFYASTAGYGVFADTLAVGSFGFPGTQTQPACGSFTAPCPVVARPDRVDLCFKTPAFAYRVYAGSLASVLRSFTADAGRPPPAPPIEFGGQKWRGVWAQNTAAILRADTLTYRKLRIPLTWMHISDPWEIDRCWGTLKFDPKRFPHPGDLVGWLRGQGLHTMIWISPLVRKAPSCGRAGYHALLGSAARGETPMVDLSDRASAKLYEQRLQRVFALGIDGIKGDRGDELDLEALRAGKPDATTLQNRYPVVYARDVAAALRAAGQDEFASIFRAGALGSQTVLPGIDVGDEPQSWTGMRTAIRAGLTASASGIAVWGSDIGGYANVPPPATPEMFLRWAQLGAVTPVFEVGGLGTSSHFWDWGAATTAGFRAAAVLHYELVPTFVDLSRLASTTGLPITRPLGLDAPADEAAWQAQFEFTVGSSLLAAPVTDLGTTPSVYLPAGRWIDLFNGSTLAGPVTYTRPTPDDEFPLYLRTGAAIPFNLRAPDVWRKPWGLSDLVRPDRAGWLLAPGGTATKATSTTAGSLRAATSGQQVTISVSHAPAETQVLVLTPATPSSVTIDGRRTRGSSVAGLRRKDAGWTMRSQPFGGIVLKLHPVQGSASATIILG
jgi:alpha-D-xyloside xylohydrolase